MTIDIKEKIADFIRRGAIQLSRKYRHIAVPYNLSGDFRTYLDILKQRDFIQWQRLEEIAKDLVMRADRGTHIELSSEEFNEWLRQRNCKPISDFG